ncbi:hypothetical protein CDO73_12295 [Saccharibacillus sp. O23]|uniref:hypothetical protein n=1 Tax=Saccharibacillus sp. O23 TaxID=2009338 RepID=UPI000B4E6E71|nr:hypothetical protein [Saccharibacillus sp. O23]OWR29860.1 hypothetical protein CDO73_12295 [Saccharibacillus sp. O23]
MDKYIEYGIVSAPSEEKPLAANLKAFFAPLNRVMVKTKSKGLLNARLPYVYSHYYWNLNKEMQVYVELYPNTDNEGKRKFANPDVGWILFANMREVPPPHGVPIEEQEQYVQELLAASGFPYVVLHEYRDGEERL